MNTTVQKLSLLSSCRFRILFHPIVVMVHLALTSLFLTTAAHADMADIIRRGYMTVATEDNYPPFNYITDGQPNGFHKDLLEDLKAYAKFDIRQDILPWTGLLASVVAGHYDMGYTCTGITAERLRAFDFSPPYASAQHYYIKRKGDERLHSIQSLSGKTVGVQAGSVEALRLPELENMLKKEGGTLGKVIEYPSFVESYADLANGRLDYVVHSIVAVNALVKTRPEIFEKGIAVSGDGFMAWPVPKNNPELLRFLTGFIDHIRATGRLAELQKKWFGETFDALPHEPITSAEQFHRLIETGWEGKTRAN